MTGMTKPAFPIASLIVQAAMAAAFLVGVTGAARAQAVINQDDGGLVQWTIGLNGVSVAPGVSRVNLNGLGYFCCGSGSSSWSNGSVSVSGSAPYAAGAPPEYLDTPGGGRYPYGLTVLANSYGNPGMGTATLTLPSASGYFGALVNSATNSLNTLAFYSGTTLVDSINITSLGTYIPASVNGGTDYASYLNVDFLGGVTYNKVVITESGGTTGHDDWIVLGDIASSSSPVSLASLNGAPLPALGGTAMGLLALAGGALRGMFRRRAATV